METISDYVFWGCKSLKEVAIPDSVSSIGTGCFAGCKSLKKIVLGKQVMSIGEGNFCECYSLQKIIVHPDNSAFITKQGCLYQQKQKLLCFNYTKSRKVSVAKGTRRIGAFAFTHHSKLQEVKIPASVTEIDGGAFYQCKNLRKVTFAKKAKCKEIKDFWWSYDEDDNTYGCFQYCNKLGEIRFPESFQYIGHECLGYCTSLKKIYFGRKFKGYRIDVQEKKRDGYDPIEIRASRLDCNLIAGDTMLKTVEISKKNSYFCSRDGVIYDKKMMILYFCPQGKTGTKLKIPKSVKIISHWAFDQCKKIRSVVIQGKNTKIESTAFKQAGHIVLYGKKNSKAQKYAKKHKMKFIAI